MTVAPPPRFSITKRCPIRAPVASAATRIVASTPPPAANGTMIWIVRFGYPWANAGLAAKARARAPKLRREKVVPFTNITSPGFLLSARLIDRDAAYPFRVLAGNPRLLLRL